MKLLFASYLIKEIPAVHCGAPILSLNIVKYYNCVDIKRAPYVRVLALVHIPELEKPINQI